MALCYYCGLPGAKHGLLRPNGNVWTFCDECYEERMAEEETEQALTGSTLTEKAFMGVL